MTTLLFKPDDTSQWGSMPGWNVVADLTPPELINSRWIAVLRRRIVMGLILVVVACAAAYTYAVLQNGKATSDANAASDQTAGLTRAAAKYAGITRIETAVNAADAQVAGVMKPDVDVAHVIAAIRTALPNTMAIQNLTLTLTPATVTGAAGLDASGQIAIGTVTISGSGRKLDDLPAFVDRLAALPGVINVFPSSNQVSAGKAQFALTASLTDRLYSHRYDVVRPGGK